MLNIEEGEKILTDLLKWLNIPIKDGTKNTPKRMAKMYVELFNGLYSLEPDITTFDGDKDGSYIAITNIPFVSMCEHHFLPFIGKCNIVYKARNSLLGLSKFARIVKYYSSRPQIQERLTLQIADYIMNRLNPYGVYVVMSAEHLCMTIRGVKSIGSITKTAELIGDIDKNEAINLLESNI